MRPSDANHLRMQSLSVRDMGNMKYFALLVIIFSIPIRPVYGDTFIRVNQIGYPAGEEKTAIIGSNENLSGTPFFIENTASGKIEFFGKIPDPIDIREGDTPFEFNHPIDFSPLNRHGVYRLFVENRSESPPFKIGSAPYSNVMDILLQFLRAARCGNTNPERHAPCHLHDATDVPLDVTGGWHDAGDYIKFSKKESYVTYLLLLSYAVHTNDAHLFSDLNNNHLPDILDEARVGIDYLLKLYPNEQTFVYRVGDKTLDHRQGMRMPESDQLAAGNRPALVGFDRNNLAKYAYTMALAANVFQSFPAYREDAKTYISLAKRAYRKAINIDTDHFDKLCLAATELYRVTNNGIYLSDAKRFNDLLGKSDRGSYDTNVNFAHVRLAPFYSKAASKLNDSLEYMLNISNNRVFGFPTRQYSWGSLYIAMSGGSACWMQKHATGDARYNQLNHRIRDYATGVNPWGVCFISGLGTNYPRNTHGNLPSVLFKSGSIPEMALPGSVALGPVSREYWEKEWHHLIPWHEKDIYADFQPRDCLYHDHSHDFVTNEPCIYGSAEAILFFSQYLDKMNNETKSNTAGNNPVSDSGA